MNEPTVTGWCCCCCCSNNNSLLLLFFLRRCWRIWKEHHSKANEVRLHCLILFMTTTTVKCTIRWIYMCFPQINKLHYITIIHVTLFTLKSVLNGCPVLSEGMAQFVSKPFFSYFLSVTLPLIISSFSLDPCMSPLFCFRARFHSWLFPFIFSRNQSCEALLQLHSTCFL